MEGCKVPKFLKCFLGTIINSRELIMRKKRSGAIKMLKKENPIQLARRYGRRWRGRVRDKLHPD